MTISGTKQTFGLNFHQASILTMKVGAGILTAGFLYKPSEWASRCLRSEGRDFWGLGVDSLLLTLRGDVHKRFQRWMRNLTR